MTIIIIEDEPLTATDLAETILRLAPETKIAAKLNSVREAINWLKKNQQPDLIFSDIQLGDGLCFEIFGKIPLITPVIFCTAYDEYALKAFKSNGIDYILKPFDEQTIGDALSKYKAMERRFISSKPGFDKISQLFVNRNTQKKVSVLVYHKDKILPVKADDIALFYIDHDITHLVTFEKKNYAINKTLEELEVITGSSFFRANRQYLVNRKAVREASQYFARKLSLSLTIPFDEKITISKIKVPDFLNWLSEN